MSPQEWVGYSFLLIGIILISTYLTSICLRRRYQKKLRYNLKEANYKQKITAKLTHIKNGTEYEDLHNIEIHPKELNVRTLGGEPSKGKQNE